ncbi:MAG TPA: FtsQ-type POTRA domain-containing protein [Verrucomicrobiae bacterium]|nr:FtsQ-type POTRA domain-containing protein [Verrucomicrobiae bacterium]
MFGRGDKKKFERQWLLDVRSRSKPLKAVRLRMALNALAISTGIVLVLFVSWKGGEFLLDRYVYTNPAFAIERIDLQTDGIIPTEQIRIWANVQKGQNLLGLDLGRIKRDLELVPLIEAASVERILARQMIIRVREREPIARVTVFSKRAGDGLLQPSAVYLDEHGMVIPPVLRALNTEAFDHATRFLPTITGVSAAAFRPGHIVDSSTVLAALQWLRACQGSEMAGRADIRAMDVSSPAALLVSTEQGNEVTFSYRNFETQLARWRKVHDFAGRRARTIASLDLAVTNYVPAVWLDRTNEPAAVRPTQISPYRKKHV